MGQVQQLDGSIKEHGGSGLERQVEAVLSYSLSTKRTCSRTVKFMELPVKPSNVLAQRKPNYHQFVLSSLLGSIVHIY